jgi:hypothetical protein
LGDSALRLVPDLLHVDARDESDMQASEAQQTTIAENTLAPLLSSDRPVFTNAAARRRRLRSCTRTYPPHKPRLRTF